MIYKFKDSILRRALIERLKIAFNCSNIRELAELLDNTSEQNFLQKLARGGETNQIIAMAINESINLHWLLTGQGEMRVRPDSSSPDALDDETRILLDKTRDILHSRSIYQSALTSNILAFHQAITGDTVIDQLKAKIEECDERLNTVEERLKDDESTETG